MEQNRSNMILYGVCVGGGDLFSLKAIVVSSNFAADTFKFVASIRYL